MAVTGAGDTAFGPCRLAARPIEAHDGSPLADGARITKWYTGSPSSFELQVDSGALYRIFAESSEFDTLLRHPAMAGAWSRSALDLPRW